jgi:excisionase family DNA binding protein
VYLDVKELSRYLNIKPSTLYAWASQGKLPSLKVHGLLRFDKGEIDDWLAGFQKESQNHIVSLPVNKNQDIDLYIARAKREAYNVSRGETRPKSAPRKEDKRGAV